MLNREILNAPDELTGKASAELFLQRFELEASGTLTLEGHCKKSRYEATLLPEYTKSTFDPLATEVVVCPLTVKVVMTGSGVVTTALVPLHATSLPGVVTSPAEQFLTVDLEFEGERGLPEASTSSHVKFLGLPIKRVPSTVDRSVGPKQPKRYRCTPLVLSVHAAPQYLLSLPIVSVVYARSLV